MHDVIDSGFRTSNSTFNAMVMRYSDNEGHVVFDDFVASYVKLKSMFSKLAYVAIWLTIYNNIIVKVIALLSSTFWYVHIFGDVIGYSGVQGQGRRAGRKRHLPHGRGKQGP